MLYGYNILCWARNARLEGSDLHRFFVSSLVFAWLLTMLLRQAGICHRAEGARNNWTNQIIKEIMAFYISRIRSNPTKRIESCGSLFSFRTCAVHTVRYMRLRDKDDVDEWSILFSSTGRPYSNSLSFFEDPIGRVSLSKERPVERKAPPKEETFSSVLVPVRAGRVLVRRTGIVPYRTYEYYYS